MGDLGPFKGDLAKSTRHLGPFKADPDESTGDPCGFRRAGDEYGRDLVE
jgi:hypothetical protein